MHVTRGTGIYVSAFDVGPIATQLFAFTKYAQLIPSVFSCITPLTRRLHSHLLRVFLQEVPLDFVQSIRDKAESKGARTAQWTFAYINS